MAKFNSRAAKGPTTTTYNGAPAYMLPDEVAWVNMLCSSFLANQTYESDDSQQERFVKMSKRMADKRGVYFLCRAAAFSRNELGIRSASCLLAAIVNGYQFDVKRQFFANFFKRPDDVAEVMCAISALGGTPSHAFMRGAADYLSGLSEYTLAKYKMDTREYNLRDLIRLTHANSPAIDRFMHEDIQPPATWEAAFNGSPTDEEKGEIWAGLVENRNLGYVALIRNLRNIVAYVKRDAKWFESELCPQITDANKITKSGIYPYQIYSAYKYAGQVGIPMCVATALELAFTVSIGNMPELEGSTLFALDVSGSMESAVSNKSSLTIKELCACYCAAGYIANKGADFIKFGTDAKAASYNRAIGAFSIIRRMAENDDCGFGTNIVPMWQKLDKHYDRVIFFSDMQVMDASGGWRHSYKDPIDAKRDYEGVFGPTRLFSFDCAAYDKVGVDNPNSGSFWQFTALNDSAYKFISLIEGGGSIIDVIDAYSF